MLTAKLDKAINTIGSRLEAPRKKNRKLTQQELILREFKASLHRPVTRRQVVTVTWLSTGFVLFFGVAPHFETLEAVLFAVEHIAFFTEITQHSKESVEKIKEQAIKDFLRA